MKNSIHLFLSLGLLFLSKNLFSQDVITLNDGSVLKVRIVEVGESEVKYKPFKGGDRVVVMDRTIVKKIRYEGEQTTELSKDEIEKNYFFNDHKEALKLGFTGILGNGISIAYERALNPTQSWEVVGRYQGIGFSRRPDVSSGYGATFGFRQAFNSSTRKAVKSSHTLSGWYIKPEISIMQNEYNFDNNGVFSFNGSTIKSSVMGTAGLNIGGQWVFNNTMLFEIFTGLGFGGFLSTQKDPNRVCNDCQNDVPSVSALGGESTLFDGRILYNFGIRIGGVFDSKKRKNRSTKTD
jgi:hypothetical protein